jgi:hypothetical protein
MMEAVYYPETLVFASYITLCHSPEDHNTGHHWDDIEGNTCRIRVRPVYSLYSDYSQIVCSSVFPEYKTQA